MNSVLSSLHLMFPHLRREHPPLAARQAGPLASGLRHSRMSQLMLMVTLFWTGLMFATSISSAAENTLSAENYVLSFENSSPPSEDDGILFSDDFSRDSDPQLLVSPWLNRLGAWRVTGGTLQGGTDAPSTYGYAIVNGQWTNYSYTARIQFPTTSA